MNPRHLHHDRPPSVENTERRKSYHHHHQHYGGGVGGVECRECGGFDEVDYFDEFEWFTHRDEPKL